MVQPEEQISEVINENQEFEDIVYGLKPWIIQNIHMGNFQAIFKKVCSLASEDDLKDFMEELDRMGMRERKPSNDFENLVAVLKLYCGSNSQTSYRNAHRAEKIKETIAEYKKLLSQKAGTGESLEYLRFLIKDLEDQLGLLTRPQFHVKSGKFCQKIITEVFDFYSSTHELRKTPLPSEIKKLNHTITLSTFTKFCKDFRLLDYPQLTAPIIDSIFKKHALYYKLMHRDQFFHSLIEISRLLYSAPSRLELLYEYLGFYDTLAYKTKLKKTGMNLNLEHSRSEKIINQTLPCRDDQLTGNMRRRANLGQKPIISVPQTSCYKARTPITWKILSETDFNSLGKEFDVTDLVVQTPEKESKAGKGNREMSGVNSKDDRSKSELLTRLGRKSNLLKTKTSGVC